MTSKAIREWFERPIFYTPRRGVCYRRLLSGWIEAQKRYASLCRFRDFSHNYSERPHIGFVAAGVWLAGGIALEEWRTEKLKGRDESYGRCDLWFRLPQGVGHHVEAKHRQLTLKDDEQWNADRLSGMMEDALGAASRLRSREIHLGMLTAGIFLPRRGCPSNPASLLRASLRLLNASCCDAAAALLLNKAKMGSVIGVALLLRRLPESR